MRTIRDYEIARQHCKVHLVNARRANDEEKAKLFSQIQEHFKLKWKAVKLTICKCGSAKDGRAKFCRSCRWQKNLALPCAETIPKFEKLSAAELRFLPPPSGTSMKDFTRQQQAIYARHRSVENRGDKRMTAKELGVSLATLYRILAYESPQGAIKQHVNSLQDVVK